MIRSVGSRQASACCVKLPCSGHATGTAGWPALRDVRSVCVVQRRGESGDQPRVLLQFAVNCPDCGGIGSAGHADCRECGGEGRVSANEPIDVEVPSLASAPARGFATPGWAMPDAWVALLATFMSSLMWRLILSSAAPATTFIARFRSRSLKPRWERKSTCPRSMVML